MEDLFYQEDIELSPEESSCDFCGEINPFNKSCDFCGVWVCKTCGPHIHDDLCDGLKEGE